MEPIDILIAVMFAGWLAVYYLTQAIGGMPAW